MTSFHKEYAKIYDILYSEKDYRGEVGFVERFIKKYKPGAKNILDYGCGTGSHAKILAQRGYMVFCLDPNENMLEIARKRLTGYKNVQILNTAKRERINPDSIDVVLSLFDVVSYMNTNKQINDFLNYAKRILVKGGLLIFDFWYGPGVINLRPEKRWKEYKIKEKNILRLTTPVHDIEDNIVKVNHEVIVWNRNKILGRFRDEHKMRYFFKNEMKSFLDRHKFKIIKFGTLNNINVSATVNDWSALIICKS